MTRTLFKNLTAILMSAVVAAVLAACNNPGSDAQVVARPENIVVNANSAARDTRITPDGYSVALQVGFNNCHGFAWQCDMGVPYALPGYAIESGALRKFWEAGNTGSAASYTTIASATISSSIPPGNVGIGDKVVYGTVRHSAVVQSLNPLRFISYCISYGNNGIKKPRIHRPDDPAGIFADAGDNDFGQNLAYYQVSTTYKNDYQKLTEPIQGGSPITVLYGRSLAAEKDGWNYTTYVVNNWSNKVYNFRWIVIPNNYSLSQKWVKDFYNTRNFAVNVQNDIMPKYPNATQFYMQIYLYNTSDTSGGIPGNSRLYTIGTIYETRKRTGEVIKNPY